MEDFDAMYKEVKQEEEQRAAQLARILTKLGREADAFQAAEDAEFRERLYQEFGL